MKRAGIDDSARVGDIPLLHAELSHNPYCASTCERTFDSAPAGEDVALTSDSRRCVESRSRPGGPGLGSILGTRVAFSGIITPLTGQLPREFEVIFDAELDFEAPLLIEDRDAVVA
jgi:hypothetical protein